MPEKTKVSEMQEYIKAGAKKQSPYGLIHQDINRSNTSFVSIYLHCVNENINKYVFLLKVE